MEQCTGNAVQLTALAGHEDKEWNKKRKKVRNGTGLLMEQCTGNAVQLTALAGHEDKAPITVLILVILHTYYYYYYCCHHYYLFYHIYGWYLQLYT